LATQVNSPGWATYLRVSDEDKQSPERSFAMQRQSIHDQLLEPSSVPFNQEYRDMLTGTNTNRKDYQQMLADAAAGKFSHLGLYRADRFGRNAAEGLEAATKLMSLGVMLRVADMPSLAPETPDGYLMFIISMGLAQHEVDVLRQRTRNGMEQKMRKGGWPQRAPDGYINRERLISSNKYERWVEIDTGNSTILREAWELLLTGRYTLKQICEELAKLGFTRQSGRAWFWNDPNTGKRIYADNRLHKIFHNPFYAGWVVSKRFDIKMGEVCGNWDPIVSTQEFERGIEILKEHDAHKSRVKKHFYLLRNIAKVRVGSRVYKLYGSTPSGKTKSFSYYITKAKIQGKKLRFPCKRIDHQIPEWINQITVDPERLSDIQEIYQTEINKTKKEDWKTKPIELKRKKSLLKDEEARLGRLFITGKMSEETYDLLHKEWREKLRQMELTLADMEREASIHFDDLEVALALMSKLSTLFPRLMLIEQSALLQVLVKQIIVNLDGEIIDYELCSPFMYLDTINENYSSRITQSWQSKADTMKTQKIEKNLSAENFLSSIRFENRGLLDNLSIDSKLGKVED